MRVRVLAVVAWVLVLAVARLSAHDFWLAAENWTPAAGTPVTITAGVGEKFPTRTNFRSRDNWLAEWRLVGATGDVTVSKDFRRSNLVMASDVTLPAAGAYLGVAMVSAQTIEMKGQEFTDYLKEEGLDNIIAARKTAGESDQTTKERYARYAKIALRNGPGAAAAPDTRVRPSRRVRSRERSDDGAGRRNVDGAAAGGWQAGVRRASQRGLGRAGPDGADRRKRPGHLHDRSRRRLADQDRSHGATAATVRGSMGELLGYARLPHGRMN